MDMLSWPILCDDLNLNHFMELFDQIVEKYLNTCFKRKDYSFINFKNYINVFAYDYYCDLYDSN